VTADAPGRRRFRSPRKRAAERRNPSLRVRRVLRQPAARDPHRTRHAGSREASVPAAKCRAPYVVRQATTLVVILSRPHRRSSSGRARCRPRGSPTKVNGRRPRGRQTRPAGVSTASGRGTRQPLECRRLRVRRRSVRGQPPSRSPSSRAHVLAEAVSRCQDLLAESLNQLRLTGVSSGYE